MSCQIYMIICDEARCVVGSELVAAVPAVGEELWYPFDRKDALNGQRRLVVSRLWVQSNITRIEVELETRLLGSTHPEERR